MIRTLVGDCKYSLLQNTARDGTTFYVCLFQTGQHWFVVLRVTKSHYEVFDSLGISESQAKERLGKITGHCFYNTARLQPHGSVKCAEFSCFFIFTRALNFDEDFEDTIESYFKADDLDYNEKIVDRWWTSGKLTGVHDN